MSSGTPSHTHSHAHRSRFNVMGRVDIDVNAALGILQDQPDDELLELAYFKMRVSLRNTVQNLASRSEKGEERDSPVVVDTFAISILNPHLYVQSSAFEQGVSEWGGYTLYLLY